jgi:LCP family protein required for cell wall assembly
MADNKKGSGNNSDRIEEAGAGVESTQGDSAAGAGKKRAAQTPKGDAAAQQTPRRRRGGAKVTAGVDGEGAEARDTAASGTDKEPKGSGGAPSGVVTAAAASEERGGGAKVTAGADGEGAEARDTAASGTDKKSKGSGGARPGGGKRRAAGGEKGGEAQKAKRKKSLKKWLISAGAVVVALVTVVVVLLNIRPTGGDVIDERINTPQYLKGKTMNILICGVNDEEGTEDPMTDVIMVANIDLERRAVSVLQIPRDTYVGEDLVETGKINALYHNGYSDGGEKPGINALSKTIYAQLKLPIDNYVTITMQGFREAVNAIGGVEITLPKTIEMVDEEQGINMVFEGGETYTLDGDMANVFVRYRGYSDMEQVGGIGDLGRMNVQRYFLSALLDKVMGLSTAEMISVVQTVYKYLVSDLTINEMLALAQQVKQISAADIFFVRLPGEGVPRYGRAKVDVFTLHRDKTAETLNDHMRPYMDPVPPEELELIEIQNTVSWYEDEGSNLEEYS